MLLLQVFEKFYNLGDNSFETDFEKSFSSINWVNCGPFEFAGVLVYCLITIYNTIQISSQTLTQKHINRHNFLFKQAVTLLNPIVYIISEPLFVPKRE